MTEPDHKVSEEIHDLHARVIVPVDVAVGLVNSEVADIEADIERTLAKVKERPLALLEACSREIGAVWTDVNVAESDA